MFIKGPFSIMEDKFLNFDWGFRDLSSLQGDAEVDTSLNEVSMHKGLFCEPPSKASQIIQSCGCKLCQMVRY